jgi:hypothetical protein
VYREKRNRAMGAAQKTLDKGQRFQTWPYTGTPRIGVSAMKTAILLVLSLLSIAAGLWTSLR